MKIIQPSYEILTLIDRNYILKHIESVARTCYKSEDKITENSASEFVSRIVKRGHHAMIEFFDIQVRFISNRGFTHEMVRHRLCSFAQESTRYVKYDGGMEVIEPYWWDNEGCKTHELQWHWESHMEDCEKEYKYLLSKGLPPQAARGVLPIDIKTEIVVKANLREWIHVFDLRCADAAHPDMRRVMLPLREEFKKELPEIYGE